MTKTTKTKKKEKVMPPPEEIPPMRVRTFDTVSTLGDECAAKVKETEDLGDKLEFLKDGLSAAVRELISIAFERAEVNDLVTNEPSFQHLQFFDPSSIFNADVDSLKVAQVMSLLTNLQSQVDKLVKQPASGVDETLVLRLEKVYKF